MSSPAAVQWADELAAWTIDPEILAAAPESPYGFPPEVFAAGQYASPSPLAELARAALGPGGLVLDVGAGAGAASLETVPAGGFSACGMMQIRLGHSSAGDVIVVSVTSPSTPRSQVRPTCLFSQAPPNPTNNSAKATGASVRAPRVRRNGNLMETPCVR